MWRGNTFIIFLLIITGCIDRIEVDTAAEPERLVVDGFITNMSRSHTIKLSKTVKFSNERNTPVNGAIVRVLGSDGEVEVFEEIEPGVYNSNQNFVVKKGITYKLQVEVDGKIIESTDQVLPDAVSFDNLEYVPERKVIFRQVDNKVVSDPGLTVRTRLGETIDKKYYLWNLKSTYIFDASRARNDNVRRCYVSSKSDFQQIYLHEDTEGGYNKDVAFIVASSDMSLGFSLLVKQFTISEEAFTFWDFILKQKENTGSIFDTPPFSISGNVRNINDSKDVVLGYFGVYEEQEIRLPTITLEDIPYEIYVSDRCVALFRGRPPECLNCTQFPGGDATTQKPDWWDD